MGKTHHVIDVANVVKYFFRELPEALISANIQDTFLQSFLKRENYIEALLLSCLLLPSITRNTLSFFMQFLYTVSLNQNFNKMSIENLAIIFTPSIMPYPNIKSLRFSNHVKIITLLIKNANGIGLLPKSIESKMRGSSSLSAIVLKNCGDHPSGYDRNMRLQNETKESLYKKNKKRRSGMR